MEKIRQLGFRMLIQRGQHAVCPEELILLIGSFRNTRLTVSFKYKNCVFQVT